ncbi:Monothiol glutaredoxin-3 [Nakaseomyces bracarensis]|uniref:Monothiol glutaredoxin-3 n=1 Tax=Nakaseomyces bracarensis TaxID=273131 RepID=A0ABR4NX67_9SACH
MSVVDVTSLDQFLKLARTDAGDKLVVLFFYMTWMEACKVLKEVVYALSRSVDKRRSNFLQINVEKNAKIVELLGITQLPAFFLVRNGVVIKALAGVDPREILDAYQECVTNVETLKLIRPEKPRKITSTSDGIEGDEEDNDELLEPGERTEEDVYEGLNKLVNAAPVMVFLKGSASHPRCKFSTQMVKMLRENNIKFGFFDILKDRITRELLKEFSDWPTFPQLYINGQFEGGVDILKESLQEDPQFLRKKLFL